jgi:hypothetical protein
MKNKPDIKHLTIEQLRKQGWKVYVSHSLDARHDNNGNRIRDTYMTHIVITDRAGNSAQGIAYSHPKDQPNRKLGNKIALGRALHEWHNENYCELPACIAQKI